MLRFLIRRILFGILVLWAVATIVFVLYFVTPHDPARVLAGKAPTAQTIAEITRALGLDKPVWIQYRTFLWNLIHGNLGFSYYSKAPVTQLLFARVSVDASLAIGGAIVWLTTGIGIGVLAARKPRSKTDRAATAFVLAGISFPTFLLGITLLFIFFFQLHLFGVDVFPGGGYIPLTQDPLAWFDHLVLPWITLALITSATYSRLTRSTLLDVMGEDYIRTARAKGLSDRRVVFVHGLRSALTPVVSQLGPDLGLIFGGGAIITEQVFGLNGVGRYALNSVISGDLPVIMGTVMFAAFFIVLANIVVDMLYAVLDPRVRIS